MIRVPQSSRNFAIFFMGAIACAVNGQVAPAQAPAAAVIRQAGKLAPREPIERDLGPQQTDVFTVDVVGRQFLHVLVDKRGVYVLVLLIDPSGKTLVTSDSPNGLFGPNPVSLISERDGRYEIRVVKSSRTPETGKYRIEMNELRTPNDADRKRLEAETEFYAAAVGNRSQDQAKRQAAMEGYLRAASIWHSLQDAGQEALCLHEVGRMSSNSSEQPKALDYLNQALSLRRAVGDRVGEANTLQIIGNVYWSLGERQNALDFYNRALPLFRAAGFRAGEALLLQNIGNVHSFLGEKRQALEYYSQALALHRAVGNRAGEAGTLSNIGIVYWNLGEMQKTLGYYNEALALYRAVGDRAGEASTLGNLGIVYSDLGVKQKALDYHNQALALSRVAGNRPGEASTLNSIGNVYSSLGERQQALDYYNQALPLRRAVRDPVGEAVTLSNIGNVYLELGEEQKALDYYNQALPLRRAVADRRGEAQTLNNIGTVYLDLKEGQKALDYYNQALPLARAVGDRVSEADTLDNLGRDYWNMGEKQNALDHFSESLPLRRAVGDRAGEATTLAALESFFSSQPDLAIFFGKLAVNTLQSIRRDNQGLNQNLQRTYEASISTHYRSLASSLIDRGRFGETEEVLTLLKDKEASDVVRRDAVTDQLRPATLLDPEKRAFARYEEILSKPDTASSALAAFLEGQQKAFAADTSIATRAAEFKEPDGLQDTLRRLGPDVAAIYTLLAPDKYVAMLVTSGTRQAYTTQIKEADLNKKIFDFRRKLQDPTSDPVPLARELYAIVFPEGLRRDLDATHARTIMWSIDNTLRYLPIAALHDGHDYLVKSFRNSLITHESLAQLAAQPAPKWQGAGFGVSDASPPLPSVPLELKSIFRQDAAGSGAIPGTVRLNAQFTRTSFEIDLKRKHNDVVHIATHFDSRPGVAANSHLILGDGQMSLAEIESKPGLFDGVELLTLSACNTAFTNRNEDGREVDSFGTIAQRLGAKSVIASLWSVNDPATARFMEAVYRLREQEGIPKNEALRQAQEAMLSGKLAPSGAAEADRGVRPAGAESHKASSNWSHPFFWAPFILIGNWK